LHCNFRHLSTIFSLPILVSACAYCLVSCSPTAPKQYYNADAKPASGVRLENEVTGSQLQNGDSVAGTIVLAVVSDSPSFKAIFETVSIDSTYLIGSSIPFLYTSPPDSLCSVNTQNWIQGSHTFHIVYSESDSNGGLENVRPHSIIMALVFDQSAGNRHP
jgi:hypothetical protein